MLIKLLFLSFLLLPQLALSESVIPVLSPASFEGWDKKVFKSITKYSLKNIDGRDAVQAVSQNAASGLVKKMKIDLKQTPYLHWSWRIDNILQGNNEQTKGGDDYSARVYVVVSGGVFFWKTRALNYVWASQQPQGTTWASAYTSQAHMLAIRSGTQGLAQWHHESRNVLEDLKHVFKENIQYIDAVALMTDTDDTEQQAIAYYGEIYFSDRP